VGRCDVGLSRGAEEGRTEGRMKSTRTFGAGKGTQIYISPSHPSLPPSFPQAITWLHAFQHEDWEWDFFINMSAADIPIVSIPEIEVGREGREGGKEGGLEYGYLFPLFVRSHPSTSFLRFLDLLKSTDLIFLHPSLPPSRNTSDFAPRVLSSATTRTRSSSGKRISSRSDRRRER